MTTRTAPALRAKRITVKRGKVSRKFVLTAPPFPRVDDEITIDGVEWFVSRVADTEVIGKLPIAFACAEGR
jgi:hypothetical protein